MKFSMLCRSLVLVLLIYYVLPCNATPTILVLGDSLSAGYGMAVEQSWVQLLVKRLQQNKLDFSVVNASVSGSTSADGLRALPDLLTKHHPNIMILALGSNDGLRGRPLAIIKSNLEEIIDLAQAQQVKILLIGFRLPENYGELYTKSFARIFSDMQDKYKLDFVPFLLDGFATDLKYFQADTLHPTAQAQPLILDNVWPYLQVLLK